MLRNSLAILAGLAVALTIILLGITADKHWFDELKDVNLSQKADIVLYWRDVIHYAPDAFFIAMLISCGVGSLVGGIVTGILVNTAKEAYAMLIGFILLLAAIADIVFTPYHPTWYEIGLFFVFFPFSWLGGKFVALCSKGK